MAEGVTPTATPPRLGEAVNAYFTSLQAGQRETHFSARQRFVRHLGGDRELSALRTVDRELYQEQLGDTSIDSSKLLEGVRAFLAEAKKRRWTEQNLSTHIKIRRRAT